MAYTKIKAIKSTLNKALAYIENAEKTDGALLITGYNCDPLYASAEFEMTAALSRQIKGDYTKAGGADILAYHMIQSFAAHDKLTAEEAHELGKKWADEILGGKYEYVISTHIDKGQIHNHVMFNATSFYNYKKYETVPYKTVALLRRVSDRLCEEKGLHVIRNQKGKGKSWKEQAQRKQGASWKEKLEKSIDRYITESSDFEDFLKRMETDGFTIKRARYTSYKLPGWQGHFTGGPTLGPEYTDERIKERIQQHITSRENEPSRMAAGEYSADEKAPDPAAPYRQQIEYMGRRSRLVETKEMANALLTIRREGINSHSDFSRRLSELEGRTAEVNGTLKTLENKNLQYKNAAKYLITYSKYLPIKQEMDEMKPGTRKYLAHTGRFESELLAFNFAATQLEKMGLQTNVDPEKVVNLVKRQDERAAELSETLKAVDERIHNLRQAKNVVDRLMGRENTSEKTKRKDMELT